MRYAIPLVVCASILTSPSAATAQSYTVYPLQPFFAYDGFFPARYDINNSLQIVVHTTSFLTRALLWDGSSQARALPIPPGRVSTLHINNAGLIAGSRELGPRRSELFMIENGTYRPRSVPIAWPSVTQLTDTGIMLVFDRATDTSWIVHGSHVERLDDNAFDVNDAGVLVGGFNQTTGLSKYIRFADGRRVEPWPERIPVTRIGPSGHVAGSICPLEGCMVRYARPDGKSTLHQFLGSSDVVTLDLNRSGELLVSAYQGFFLARHMTNLVYRDGPIIDLNTVVLRKGWVMCEAVSMNDQGAIVALAARLEGFQRGTNCQLVLLYPDPPAAPRDFVATVSGRTVTLTWTSGADVRGHILEVGSAPGASNLLQMSLAEQPSLMTSAPPGRYYVRIRARNGVATGVPSSELVVDVH